MGLLSMLMGGNANSAPDLGGQAVSTMGGASTLADRLSSPLSQVGLAMMAASGGQRTGFAAPIAQGLANAGKLQKEQQQRNKTLEMLQQDAPDLAGYIDAGVPVATVFNAWANRKAAEQKAKLGLDLTTDQRNFQLAQSDPKFAEFLQRGRSSAAGGPRLQSIYDPETGREQRGYFDDADQFVPVGGQKLGSGNASGGETGAYGKPPSGFMYDPEDPSRLTPIPGGPGEQIGAENAGRIGIAESFLKDLPGIREDVKKGGVTGVVDSLAGRVGYGQQGRLYARIESGADALQRMLSGAGMPESEAQAYARRYMPSPMDGPDEVQSKLSQLESELNSQMDVVLRGRGGNRARTPATGGDAYKDRYGLE